MELHENFVKNYERHKLLSKHLPGSARGWCGGARSFVHGRRRGKEAWSAVIRTPRACAHFPLGRFGYFFGHRVARLRLTVVDRNAQLLYASIDARH